MAWYFKVIFLLLVFIHSQKLRVEFSKTVKVFLSAIILIERGEYCVSNDTSEVLLGVH